MSSDNMSHTLPIGYRLNTRYQIDSVLGEGGFGVTYKATGESGETVAIKEYYPSGIAIRKANGDNPYYVTHFEGKLAVNFNKGLERFRQEAYLLKAFSTLQSIVSVLDIFDANNTSYIVMEYIEGLTLKELVSRDGSLRFSEVVELFKPLLSDLSNIHKSGLVHRDISPDNIIIGMDNRLHLFDFGSANHSNMNASKTFTVILKAGYAPPEQYIPNGKIGAWTDIYGISATIFFALTGEAPKDSLQRMQDDSTGAELRKKLETVNDIEPFQVDCIIKGLALSLNERYPSISLFINSLTNKEADDRTTEMRINDHQGKRDAEKKAASKKLVAALFLTPLIVIAAIIGSRNVLFTALRNEPVTTTEIVLSSESTEQVEVTEEKSDLETTEEITTEKEKILTMNDLVGQSLEQATNAMEKVDPDIEIQTVEEYNDAYPKGCVTAQSIKADTQFTKGNIKTITLSVSLGEKPATTEKSTTQSTVKKKQKKTTTTTEATTEAKKKSTKKKDGYTTVHIGE